MSSTLFFKTTATAYSYDGTTITQVTDPDYPATTTRGCAFLDGKFFVMTPSADIYQSATENALSWSAVEFIGAAIEPDVGIFLAKYKNYIVAFKNSSTEFFYDAVNATGSILSPVMNMAFKIGCASDGSVQEMNDTVVWMGQNKTGKGRAIYQLNAGVPEPISTPQINKILEADDLATVRSWSANVGSHMMYGLTLGTSALTLVYDFTSGLWQFFTYLATSGGTKTVTAVSALGVVTATAHGYTDGQIVKIAGTTTFDGFWVATAITTDTFTIQKTGTAFSGSGTAQLYTETYFPVISSTACGGSQWMQDASTGVLYTMSQSVYADQIGAIAARIHTPKFDGQLTGKGLAATAHYKKMPMVELIGDKVNSHAVIRWSDDDYATYTNSRVIDMSIERSWLNRCGQFSRRSFEVLHVENTTFRVEALEIEVK